MGIVEKIKERSAVIAVAGLGYTGLPMALEIARAGYKVYGIDPDRSKIASLLRKQSYLMDIRDEDLKEVINEEEGLIPGDDYACVALSDALIICVPTPLDKNREPDPSFIRQVIEEALPYLKPQTLIILESTTYPGTTRELVSNVIEARRGWVAGEDFYVCYSPERINPGKDGISVKQTPKIIGGCTARCLEAGSALYGSFVETLVPVSSTTLAETAKLLENTFRSVNIALINELTPLCERMGISIWEVLEAAATKPFGYMPFYPGPGVGGHCIPVDPLYLSWKSGKLGLPLHFVELADRVNQGMPGLILERIQWLLQAEGKTLKGSKIILSGIAYKKDIDDIRESPALALFVLLLEAGAIVQYCDPYIPSFKLGEMTYFSRTLQPSLLSSADLVVIATDHSAVDYQGLADAAPLVLDTRNATRDCTRGRIAVLGKPYQHQVRWGK